MGEIDRRVNSRITWRATDERRLSFGTDPWWFFFVLFMTGIDGLHLTELFHKILDLHSKEEYQG